MQNEVDHGVYIVYRILSTLPFFLPVKKGVNWIHRWEVNTTQESFFNKNERQRGALDDNGILMSWKEWRNATNDNAISEETAAGFDPKFNYILYCGLFSMVNFSH
jgi:hypothetical protein